LEVELNADTSLAQLLFDQQAGLLPKVIILGQDAHPGPSKVEHQLSHCMGDCEVTGHSPKEEWKLSLVTEDW
jgi:hypothetical protein